MRSLNLHTPTDLGSKVRISRAQSSVPDTALGPGAKLLSIDVTIANAIHCTLGGKR